MASPDASLATSMALGTQGSGEQQYGLHPIVVHSQQDLTATNSKLASLASQQFRGMTSKVQGGNALLVDVVPHDAMAAACANSNQRPQ